MCMKNIFLISICGKKAMIELRHKAKKELKNEKIKYETKENSSKILGGR